MKIKELLERLEYTVVSGQEEVEITGICRDNRKAEEGNLFICISGARFDTHSKEVLEQLAEKKIAAVITEKQVECPDSVTVIRVKDTRVAAAHIYAAFYGHPAEHMTMIGITGSKGKTTTTHMLADILRAAGHHVGTIGTNGAIIDGEVHELSNTTPDSDEVQMFLAKMVKAGCDYAVVEVSSQGMKQHRVDGFTFDYGVWMNISTGDHIGPNEHETFEDYLWCKAQLLQHSKLGFVHMDDPYREDLMKLVSVPVEYFGACEGADYRGTNIQKTFTAEEGCDIGNPGISFDVSGKMNGHIHVNQPGEFNVWNALAAIAVADHCGVTVDQMNQALSKMHIKGRIDMVYRGPKFSVCVDFAHNGLSTRNHLEALREFHPKRVVCVFGADGNRSKDRRYEMGEASGKEADLSIVTAGHNRFESFEQIFADIKVGLDKAPGCAYIVIPNRKEAIRYAIEHAEEGDLITIIGLGHETWQEENGVKYPHSDTEFVKQVVKEMGLI